MKKKTYEWDSSFSIERNRLFDRQEPIYFRITLNSIQDTHKCFNGVYYTIPITGTYYIQDCSTPNSHSAQINNFKAGDLIKVPNFTSKAWKVLYGNEV